MHAEILTVRGVRLRRVLVGHNVERSSQTLEDGPRFGANEFDPCL